MLFNQKQKLSLVLSGGSALGFAHLGVIKYLEEQKIKPDEIIGTSMGAIVATFIAKGYKYEEINKIIEEMSYLKLLKINIFTLKSLINVKKIKKFLVKFVGEETTFENLKIDLKIIATKLSDGKVQVFDKTTNDIKVIDALCASFAIPGVFEPYKIEEEEYLDGFLSSNLPFEFATNKKIIAVDVINEKYIKKLKHKYSIPTLEKSFFISILNQTRQKLKYNKKINLVNLDVSEFKSYDYFKWKKIEEQGYEEMKKEMKK